MGTTRRLFAIIAEGAIVFTLGSWALTFAAWAKNRTVFDSPISSFAAGVGVVAVVLVPDCLAAWWIFRKLLTYCQRSDARRGAIGFAVSAPLALGLAYLLGPLVGGYAEVFLGSRFFLPSIAVLILVLIVFIPGAIVMWILHPSGGVVPASHGETR